MATIKKRSAKKKTTKKKGAVAVRNARSVAVRNARSIADLMQIRAHPENRVYLDSINGNLGTALGFKKKTDQTVSREPAVIVFVPQKVHGNWINESQRIRKELSIPGKNGQPGIRCPLDVVEGGKAETLPPVRPTENELVKRLRGGDPHLWCGSQLAVLDNLSRELVGTLGAFARRKKDGKVGFITNDHVALGDRLLFHPTHATGRSVGFRVGAFLKAVSPEEWYGPFAAEPGAADTKVHVDCEFLRLDLTLPDDLIRPALPTVGKLGAVYDIDLEADMDSGASSLLGQRVLKIGRTTGLTRGTIAAFAYEWLDGEGETRYTDLLIGPDHVTEGGRTVAVPFSERGDSGSLVVVENGLRPVALMWGGFLEKLRSGNVQENWTYASRLDQILGKLGLALL